MPLEFDLIAPDTRLDSNGSGSAIDIRISATRTFYCVMQITEQIEQESLDVAIWGSADGENWGAQPFLRLPQRFYRGETRAVLDLALSPEVNFIRASWELNRWGRVAPVPMFVLGLRLSEIPAMPHRPNPVTLSASE